MPRKGYIPDAEYALFLQWDGILRNGDKAGRAILIHNKCKIVVDIVDKSWREQERRLLSQGKKLSRNVENHCFHHRPVDLPGCARCRKICPVPVNRVG